MNAFPMILACAARQWPVCADYPIERCDGCINCLVWRAMRNEALNVMEEYSF